MQRRIDYHIYFDDEFMEKDTIDKFMTKLKKKFGASVFSEEWELAQ